MAALAFEGKLTRPDIVGSWTYVELPGVRSRPEGWGSRTRVRGTIDGSPVRTTLVAGGGGSLLLIVPKPIRELIGKESGDRVRVALDADSAPVKILLPPELRAALARDAEAGRRFRGLAPSHRKEYARWVGEGKAAETRARRSAEAVRKVREGWTRPDDPPRRPPAG